MVQKFYWSGDFTHENKVSRFGIEVLFGDGKDPKRIILSLIQSLASVGYVYVGNPSLTEVKDVKGKLQD